MNENFKSAKDIISGKVIFIEGLDTVQDAIDKMKVENAEALIVNKRNQEDAYGIITATDIMKKVIICDQKPREVNVYEIMSKPVIAIPESLNTRYIPRLMMRAKIQIAPVEQNGEYIGMISFSGLIHQNK